VSREVPLFGEGKALGVRQLAASCCTLRRPFERDPMSKDIFWLTQTAAQIPNNDDWLSEGERNVLAGLRYSKRRHDWLLGRWTAKHAVRACLAKAEAFLCSIEIRAGEGGAPEAFCDGEPTQVSVSISHSRDRSLCAAGLHGLTVGCDLEWIEPREENFAGDYFTPEELSVVLQAPFDRESAVTLIWCAKESALKAVRRGLSRDTRSVIIRPEFGVRENSWYAWTGRCLETSLVFHGWWRSADGFIYTIASDQPVSPPAAL
jgi:4'-phosphopantetheinyl transferase